jgi:hypothetical protein
VVLPRERGVGNDAPLFMLWIMDSCRQCCLTLSGSSLSTQTTTLTLTKLQTGASCCSPFRYAHLRRLRHLFSAVHKASSMCAASHRNDTMCLSER